MDIQKKVLNYLQSASRDLDDAERSVRNAENYDDPNSIRSILSRAKHQIDDAKRDIDDAERLVKRSWGE